MPYLERSDEIVISKDSISKDSQLQEDKDEEIENPPEPGSIETALIG